MMIMIIKKLVLFERGRKNRQGMYEREKGKEKSKKNRLLMIKLETRGGRYDL